MLAVAVQLPASVLTSDRWGVGGRAPSRSELEPEPEANAGTVSASNTQIADAKDLMLTTKPLSPGMNHTRIGRKPYARLTRPLNHRNTGRPAVPRQRAAEVTHKAKTLNDKAVDTHIANAERLLDARARLPTSA
jgi:hypothetical protein